MAVGGLSRSRETIEALDEALSEGLAQADRGELLDGADVIAEVRKDLRKRRRPDN